MRVHRGLAISAAATVIVWLAACSAIGIAAMEMTLHPERRELAPDSARSVSEMAARRQATVADVSIAAADRAVLKAWQIRPKLPNGDAVILLHGLSDNRMGMIGYADLLLSHGYTVLLPDARAHGQSGGAIATYGLDEADDVRRWFEWLAKTESPRCIDGLGESMGAAELLRALSAEPGFCAVVAESPFASFREASYDRLGQFFGTGPWLGRTILEPAVDFGFVYAWVRYGVRFSQDSPQDSVAESRIPVLLIHGLKDTNLPPRHSEQIAAASASRGLEVSLWEPAKAEHTGAIAAEPEEFERRVLAWFGLHGPRCAAGCR